MYILDSTEQAVLIRDLVLVSTLDNGWSKKYQNPVTGEIWLETFVSAGQGHFKILRNDPPPSSIAAWIDQSLTSDREADAVGLGLELSQNHDVWSDVIEYLEPNKGKFQSAKLALFVERLTILNAINRRSTLNKHYTEVENDSQYFRDLSERARRLLKAA